jgi:hypothetical protein
VTLGPAARALTRCLQGRPLWSLPCAVIFHGLSSFAWNGATTKGRPYFFPPASGSTHIDATMKRPVRNVTVA